VNKFGSSRDAYDMNSGDDLLGYRLGPPTTRT